MSQYKLKNKIRIVTAASLFDGHDAAINIMRRIIQASGAEVIHLGHDRSVKEIVDCAIQEDANAIALTSYQGGHMEYFKYMYDLLLEKKSSHIKIFGGGGGVILPKEIKELHDYGITRIYSPDDGRKLGLQGMIDDLLKKCDFSTGEFINKKKSIPNLISAAENHYNKHKKFFLNNKVNVNDNVPVLGITGTGGAGKSSIVDEIIRRFLIDFDDKNIAIISVDPSKRKTGGALLGDRIRMNAINNDRVYMRSLATRQSNLALSKHVHKALDVVKSSNFDLIILETSGIGQSDTEIIDYSDVSLYVMTPEYGAATQLEKIDMLDYADIIALNKFDKRGALDALRDIKKQYKRNNGLWSTDDSDLPVYGTIASQFNDPGTNKLYFNIIQKINNIGKGVFSSNFKINDNQSEKIYIIPPDRVRYLSEISDVVRKYNEWVNNQSNVANKIQYLSKSFDLIDDKSSKNILKQKLSFFKDKLSKENQKILDSWVKKVHNYKQDVFSYKVRDQTISVNTKSKSLSQLEIPKISLPNYSSFGDILKWNLQENVPGSFPFTSGVFPFKREGEDPTRMFAGEGGPERTNARFHYLSQGIDANRLSTAFDSVTLYGRDPHLRPDIYGKIGNAGVSICCLDDAKILYSGFDLTDSKTSVSMTINGPAAMLTGFFMNAAIDQQCEIYIKQNNLEKKINKKIKDYFQKKGSSQPKYHGDLPKGNNGLGLMLLGLSGDKVLDKVIYDKIKKETLKKVRGTVQADILKEDQAQNTCIFSTEFALKLMGDMQDYFISQSIRNFYSVSISGYHIAEAGANPISQLAFTLSNGFTYLEYYKSRGMSIDDFAPNFSFFFSNGIDPEYAVIGRVARRIWSKALKLKYNSNERSQKLKYHIQTSGRSLHAQEIDFNDIRTTLQALYAIYDNCNSLHTNAFDEAITTPTEESVRRAMAIQLIINHELGLNKNQNPLQGSFIIEELTDLVEEAVLFEFDRITERGGVLGAMETMYQRGKIQEESLYYETLKHTGEYPIIGVNTYKNSKGSPTIIPKEVIRATQKEKKNQIKTVKRVQDLNKKEVQDQINSLKHNAINNKNIFSQIMEASKFCTLGQMTSALFEVGGQYRRNM